MPKSRRVLGSMIAVALVLGLSLAAPHADRSHRSAREVMAVIDRLAAIDAADSGLVPWASVSQFLPVPSVRRMDAGILGSVPAEPGVSADLVQLVSWGPAAIPALLERLTDDTPTAFAVTHGGGFGLMWYGDELDVDLDVRAERAAFERHPSLVGHGDAWGGLDATIDRHVITVGDLCMFALGQIVNRDYAPTRYQPTACIVVRSPTRSPDLAAAVRQIWGGPNLRAKLVASWRNDRRKNEWGDSRRDGGVVRLLYYAPKVVRDGIVSDLRAATNFVVDPPADKDASDWDWWRVRTLVSSVAFSEEPRIVDAVLELAVRSGDEGLLAMALSQSIQSRHGDRLLAAVRAAVTEPSPTRFVPDQRRLRLFRAIGVHRPSLVRELVTSAAVHDGVVDRATVATALIRTSVREPWIVPMLEPWLGDEREIGGNVRWWAHGQGYPVRVCDLAAEAIAVHRDDLEFLKRHDVPDLDRQIDRMQAMLAGIDPEVDPLAPIPIDALPIVEPVGACVLDLVVTSVIDADPDGRVRAYGGRPEPSGWRIDGRIMTVDTRTAEIDQRVELPRLDGFPVWLGVLDGREIVRFDGDGTGDLVVHDEADGRELRRIPTPFHSIWDRKDEWLLHMDGPYLIASDRSAAVQGSDGGLHRFDLDTGEHSVVAGPPQRGDDGMPGYDEAHPVPGTTEVLLPGSWDHQPMLSWDVAAGTIRTLEDFPTQHVRSAAGRYVFSRVNNRFDVWDRGTDPPSPVLVRLEPGTMLGSSVVGSCVIDPRRRIMHAVAYDAENLTGNFVVTLDLRTGAPIARHPVPAIPRRSGRLRLLDDGALVVWTESQSERDDDNMITAPRTGLAVLDVDRMPVRPWEGG